MASNEIEAVTNTYFKKDVLSWLPYRSLTLGRGVNRGVNSRAHVQQSWKNGRIYEIPAANHFRDLAEASTRLVYGATLEHEISTYQLKRLADVTHNIVLVSTPRPKMFLGAVKFGRLREKWLPEALKNSKVRIPDSTRREVNVAGRYSGGPSVYKGITQLDAAGLNLECDLILLLSPVVDGDKITMVVGTSERLQKSPDHNPGRTSDQMLAEERWPEMLEHWNELRRRDWVVDFKEGYSKLGLS